MKVVNVDGDGIRYEVYYKGPQPRAEGSALRAWQYVPTPEERNLVFSEETVFADDCNRSHRNKKCICLAGLVLYIESTAYSLVAKGMRPHPVFSAPDWFPVRAPVCRLCVDMISLNPML